jgi:hypothetical protein
MKAIVQDPYLARLTGIGRSVIFSGARGVFRFRPGSRQENATPEEEESCRPMPTPRR